MNKRRAYINANIINGDMSKSLIENGTILVSSDGNIEKIGANINLTEDIEQIDLSGKYVMPGLINAHIHMFLNGAPRKDMAGSNTKLLLKLLNSKIGKAVMKRMYKNNAATFVNAGVTTVRDVGSFFELDLKTRDLVEKGKIDGPRILCSGSLIIPTGGHGHAMPGSLISDGKSEFMKNTRYNISKGVDWIKICNTGGVTDAKYVGEAGMPQMSVEEIKAVCDEAHRQNIMVASHCESTQGMRDCLAAGVDTIEHAATIEDDMIELFLDNPNTLRGYVSIIPTLAAARAIHENKEYLIESKEHDIIIENSQLIAQESINALKTAIEKGIKVGIGTDSSVPFVTPYNTYQELLFFKEVTNISNERIIEIATKDTAEIINIDKITGTLDEGKSADFIVLDKNPLDDLSNIKKPCYVVAQGKFYNNPSYKEISGVKN